MIASKDLARRPKETRPIPTAGETLQSTFHRTAVAVIQPALSAAKKPDWVARARAAGAVNRSKSRVADSIHADRD